MRWAGRQLGHYLQAGWLVLAAAALAVWVGEPFWKPVSWKYLIVNLPRSYLPLPRLFWLRLGGEALNQLTPTASLGGELFKADRLRTSGVSLWTRPPPRW